MGKTSSSRTTSPGFLVNRMLIPMLNEACFALQEGWARAEDIDTGAKLGLNHPMGPARARRSDRPRHGALHRRCAAPRPRRRQVPRADALAEPRRRGLVRQEDGPRLLRRTTTRGTGSGRSAGSWRPPRDPRRAGRRRRDRHAQPPGQAATRSTASSLAELADALVGARPRRRASACAILTGAGDKAFAAGADIEAMAR